MAVTTKDAELWLYFENQVLVNNKPIGLRLTSVESDIEIDKKFMGIFRSYVDDSAADVLPWNESIDLCPTEGSIVAVGIRLSGKEIGRIYDKVNWTLAWDSDVTEGSSADFFCSSTFSTCPNGDEGLLDCPVTNAGGQSVSSMTYRFLLLRDTTAEPEIRRRHSWVTNLDGNEVLLTGHRGMGAAPKSIVTENSIAAFQNAHALGADMVELDVQLSQDGRQAIYHDLSIDGANLCDLTWAELQQRIPELTELSEVLAKVDRGLALDVEVKYPSRQVNGQLQTNEDYREAMTPRTDGSVGITRCWSKNRVADSILGTLAPEATKRRLLITTFEPDMALALSRKIYPDLRSHLPILLLTRGERHWATGGEKHADLRNRTVRGAVSWAKAVGLDGVAPYAAGLMELDKSNELFDRRQLPALLWGEDLNSAEILKRLKQQCWATALIFDHLHILLAQVKMS